MVRIVKTEFYKLKRYHILWAGVALMLLSVLLTLFTSMANDGSVWDFAYLTEQVIKNNMSMIFPMCISLIAGYMISREQTGKLSLQGKKEKGIDDYTGSYQADYENFSDTEYLFGGTSIKREAGKDISVTCTLEVLSGTAKVFWISGADEAVTLLETTGTYSDTITLPDGGNYIGIECEDFTGKIEMNIK